MDDGQDAGQDVGADIPTEGVSIGEAAKRLGIAPEAVRKRIKRGSLEAYKAGDRWLIVLPEGMDASGPSPDAGQDTARTDELLESLRDQVGFLRRELDSRTDELRRRDVMLMELNQRIGELTARLPELPPPADLSSVRDAGQDAEQAPPETSQQPPARPWWRFW